MRTPKKGEYESGTREPSLLTILAYSALLAFSVAHIIHDNLDLFD